MYIINLELSVLLVKRSVSSLYANECYCERQELNVIDSPTWSNVEVLLLMEAQCN
jgi:hypothetical protein